MICILLTINSSAKIGSKAFYIIFGLFVSTNVLGQNRNAYKQVFNYIKKENRGREITTSDTIIHLNLSDFTKELSREWRKSESMTEHILDSIDWKREKYKQVRSELIRLGNKGSKPRVIIFFSDVFENILMAETINEKQHSGVSHYSQTLFNKSTIYLFLFDDKNKIVKMLRKYMQYN